MSEQVKWYRTKKFKALVVTIVAATLSYFDIVIPREALDGIVEALSAIGG